MSSNTPGIGPDSWVNCVAGGIWLQFPFSNVSDRSCSQENQKHTFLPDAYFQGPTQLSLSRMRVLRIYSFLDRIHQIFSKVNVYKALTLLCWNPMTLISMTT